MAEQLFTLLREERRCETKTEHKNESSIELQQGSMDLNLLPDRDRNARGVFHGDGVSSLLAHRDVGPLTQKHDDSRMELWGAVTTNTKVYHPFNTCLKEIYG